MPWRLPVLPLPISRHDNELANGPTSCHRHCPPFKGAGGNRTSAGQDYRPGFGGSLGSTGRTLGIRVCGGQSLICTATTVCAGSVGR